MSQEETKNPNFGVAFGITIGAGAATAIGAAVVFIPKLVRLANRRTLAAALGLSAGVMSYVSFVEIFVKSYQAFEEASIAENLAYIYATCCFFGGVVLMVLLNALVTFFLGGHHHHHHEIEENKTCTMKTESRNERSSADHQNDEDFDISPCVCCAEDPKGDLERLQIIADEIEHAEEERQHHHEHSPAPAEDRQKETLVDSDDAEKVSKSDSPTRLQTRDTVEVGRESTSSRDKEENTGEEEENRKRKEKLKLMRMSMNTAVAIGLHNFPEGLATFVAALADPAVGAVLAVAIAIHNIPEGLCVALPIYYATGNKWKAFAWGCLSGIAEPLAALLGYAVLASVFTPVAYGVLFGIVAGMMIIISVKELLPTAHRYDPEDTVTTYAFMIGMGIMALSLVLFIV